MRNQKAGALARIGLFMAIAHLLGANEARHTYEVRQKHHARGNPGKAHPAGFKLIKKMYRRPANPYWVKLHPKPIHSGKNRGHSTDMCLNTENMA